MKKVGDVSKKNRYGTFTKDCPILVGIINGIANKRRIPPDVVEKMIEDYHNWVYEALSCEMSPTVWVPNFGRFHLAPFRIRKKIYWLMRMKREGKLTYEFAKEKLSNLYPLWKRSWWETMKRGKGVVRKKGQKHRKSLGNLLRNKIKKLWRQ